MGELPEVINHTKRKSRKSHLCTSCGSKIEKGENYMYISGIWGGEPASFKLCNCCEKVINGFKLMDETLLDEDGPTLDRGGVSAWLQDFLSLGWQGEEAAIDIAKTFDLPISYARSQLKLT